MDRRFLMHYRSIVLSCLLFEAVLADIPCQDGVTYKNSCNPYKVNFIHFNQIKHDSYAQDEEKKEGKKRQWFSRSYLNALLDKYSSNYDGRSGLQALIDRSHYGEDKKELKEEQKRVEIASKEEKVQKSVPKEEMAPIEPETTMQEEKSREVTTTEHVMITESSKEELSTKSLATQKHVAKEEKRKEQKIRKTLPKKSQKPKVATKKPKAKLATYKIKKGDTLSSIASTLGISVKELKTFNRIGKDGKIKVGQKLIIPARLVKKLKAKEKMQAAKLKKEKELLVKKKGLQEQLKKGIYIVQKGDTLSSIAKKTNLSITQLREFNRIARSSHIKVGQKLHLKEQKVAKKRSSSLNYVKNIKFKQAPSLKFKRKIRVIATAYTSHRSQTDRTPFLAAWNNRIRPGMKIIAVSEDLIRKYGLKNGVKVKITGLPGYYVVRDKMNKRLRNHIDIYMGLNKRKALRWGRRRVALYW